MSKIVLATVFAVTSLSILFMVLWKQQPALKEVNNLIYDQTYIACGCGCCSGVEPLTECLYRVKGDDISKLIEEDKKTKSDSANCNLVGCSRGIQYKYCE